MEQLHTSASEVYDSMHVVNLALSEKKIQIYEFVAKQRNRKKSLQNIQRQNFRCIKPFNMMISIYVQYIINICT